MKWQVGEIVENQYRVSRVFTGGGMGIVYQVRHLSWDVDLAIKHPHPKFMKSAQQRDEFARECETWSGLGLHPYLATCFYTKEIDGMPCVVAEFVEGGSLNDWITSRRLYGGEDAAVVAKIIRIATAMAWGLNGAHRVSLIHCDMKPGNVLMTADGLAKITDFGLAKAIFGNGGSKLEGWMSMPWASPEQLRHEGLTFATDVWSWAVSVMEMFMGGVHWQSGAVAGAALEEFGDRGRKAVGFPAMPLALFDLLARCLNIRPTDRPPFVRIAEELREIYEDEFGEQCEAEEPDLDLLAADSLNNRAVSVLDLGRLNEAELQLRKALDEDPLHPEATFNLTVLCRSRIEKIEDWAIQNLRTAANAEPMNPIPLKLMARIFMFAGERRAAYRSIDEATERAWTESEKEEIERFRGSLEGKKVEFVLAKPQSGSDFGADLSRFRRLAEKAENAIKQGGVQDARRYAQMAADISGFGRHPRLRRIIHLLQKTVA